VPLKIIEEDLMWKEPSWPIKLDPCGIKWLREGKYYVVNAGCIGVIAKKYGNFVKEK
jgi:hypothetical protein